MLILIGIAVLGAIAQMIWRGRRVTTQGQRWAASSRADKILKAWATDTGAALIENDQRIIAKGPYFGRADAEHFVYRITAVYRGGQVKSGWVLCGSQLSAKPADQVEVSWDEQKAHLPGFPVIGTETKDQNDDLK
jgi:hypothetical protein